MHKRVVKRTVRDFVFSVLSSLLYTFARQIVILPVLAARLSEDTYGTVLTVLGLVSVLGALVGGTLNNIRLVQAQKYGDAKGKGDFLILCTAGSGLCVLAVLLLSRVFHLPALCCVLLAVYVCVDNFYQYAGAHFRLALDFERSLIQNAVVCAVCVPAALLFAGSVTWPLIFLVGDLAGLAYAAYVTGFYREGLRPCPLFWQTGRMALSLALVSVIGNLLLYADRVIIYPILGAGAVSYYTTASFFGKSAGLVAVPMAGVLLSYFSQKGFRPSKKLFLLLNSITALALLLFLGVCYFLAPIVTRLLYPTLYAHAAPYILPASVGALIGIAANMAQPMILKCCHTGWLIGNQLLYAAVYAIASALLLPGYGLLGFCGATVLANSTRLLALYAIGLLKL